MKHQLILTASLTLTTAFAQSSQTVKHELGSTDIRGTPKRIIALENSFIDALAQLNVKPAGVADDGSPLPHLAAYVKGVPTVGTRNQPSLEAILALKPDLILADLERHKNIYPQLAKIAPTLVLNSYRGSRDELLDQFSLIADLTNKDAQGKTLREEHQRLFAKTKLLTSKKAGPTVIGVLAPNGFWVHSDKSFLGTLIKDLGRDNPVSPQKDTQFVMSLEGLVATNPASIILLRNPGEVTPLDQWKTNPLWQSLPAVKAGQVYEFNRDLWAKGRGVIAFNKMLAQATASGYLQDQPAKANFVDQAK
ncbi:ABC transporter substrate-binding protein [Deinococcus peraridilitoris]|uniref:ABC-type Fe3+-citrate transport system, periplasmic component n=1 Tax=Deinococcus peraridilitoris (strain DSM 19664 / LMG 22246 / CIP 109416 / KR-200) TaxID=937777 RepID=L0A5Z6_DEIPD|nr:ABC transporter substrate-binding protein [Deinococcus peraridilitoris]AFZ69271.1 ABC-type Fe3+-citrate transport system, periplasmic component [Deinococcus peraridilitoris DSM 19664]